jgi:TonB-dependent receptor
MNGSWPYRVGVATLALIATSYSQQVFAQEVITSQSVPSTAPATQDGNGLANPVTAADEQGEIVVTGVRASARSAQSLKQNSLQVSDSIVADDIGKLPDNNVAEALSRITGVQITRSQGEGTGVIIRGLGDAQSQLNGRSIFNAVSRSVSYADVPSQLIQSVTVFKTPQADQIEGGIAGIVNTRLRRPFDFAGKQIAGSVRGFYGEQSKQFDPYANILVSDRFDTSIGEMGVLASVSYQTYSFRSFGAGLGPFLARRDLDTDASGTVTAADFMNIPGDGSLNVGNGKRKRPSANVAVQWRPTSELEVYVEGLYAGFRGREQTALLIAGTSPSGIRAGGVPSGAFEVFDGTRNYRSGSWRDVGVIPSALNRFADTNTAQAAGGYVWKKDRLTISGDVARTISIYKQRLPDTIFNSRIPRYSFDISGNDAVFDPQGFDFLNPANLTLLGFVDNRTRDKGTEWAAQNDFLYEFDDDSPLRNLKAGIRYSDRKADHIDVSAATFLSTNPSLAPFDELYEATPGNFPSDWPIRGFLVPNLRTTEKNLDYVRRAFGRPTGDPAYDPLRAYDIGERTWAGYVMGTFDLEPAGLPIDGNVGVRVIRTSNQVNGFLNAQGGGVVPVNEDNRYTRALPSINLRYKITPELFLRGSAAKQFTRQAFGSLSPTVNLNFVLATGSAGNPALRPLESRNYDLSLEWYPASTTSITLAGFQRNVDGFLVNSQAPETINGQTFLISRPRNATEGTIRGFEAGYQQFYDFLPGVLGGLGAQANYTFITSETRTDTGATARLPGLSRDSFNVALLYERGKVNVRFAYNWRSAYTNYTAIAEAGGLEFDGVAGIRSQLDGSFSYDVTDKIAITAEGFNILKPRRRDFFRLNDGSQVTNFHFFDDRRFSIGVRARLF